MLFGNTTKRLLSWIALLLAAAGLPAAQPATLETSGCVLTIGNGVIVGLSNRLSGETLVRTAGQEPGLSALHRLNQGDLWAEQATLLTNSNPAGRSEWTAEWQRPEKVVAGRMRTRFESEPGTGDILVQQEGRLTTNGLVGVSWGIAPVPCLLLVGVLLGFA